MSLAMTLFIGSASAAIGLFLGVLGMLLLIRSKPDTVRLDTLESLEWSLHCAEGRWAILQKVNGEMRMAGQSHETIRGAMDAAFGMQTDV